jgi:ribosomal protein S7
MNRSSITSTMVTGKKRSSLCIAVEALEILESAISESSFEADSENLDPTTEEVERYNHHRSRKNTRRRRCKRRCLMTRNMLERDCHKVRRLFDAGSSKAPELSNGQQNTGVAIPTIEQFTEQRGTNE